MTLPESLAQKLGHLPLDKQLEVLDFVEFLENKRDRSSPRRDPEGLLADSPSDLSLDDFAAARQEMSRNFPRGLPR
jgi:hypothetical protein